MSANLDRLKPELLIIGRGPWANKIESDIKENLSEIHPKTIAAREVLSLRQSELEALISKSIIWIATIPRLQLDLLEKLVHCEKKIIVEKPIATTKEEINRFRELLKEARFQIFVSEPWTNAEIWVAGKKIFREAVKSIEIERFGENQRDYIFPPQDWLPHDIYLLYDIFGEDFTEFRDLKSSWSEGNKKLGLNFKINEGISVSMRAGYSPMPRSAFWNVSMLDGSTYEINFVQNAIIFNGAGEYKRTEHNSRGKSPISEFLSSTLRAIESCPIGDLLFLYDSLLIPNV